MFSPTALVISQREASDRQPSRNLIIKLHLKSVSVSNDVIGIPFNQESSICTIEIKTRGLTVFRVFSFREGQFPVYPVLKSEENRS